MEIRVITDSKDSITRGALRRMAQGQFGDLVKAVVDAEQGIMAVGGEFHADEEVMLMEKHGAKREHTWGVNLYPEKPEAEWIEFDSMINVKPWLGNRSRGVENQKTQEKIKEIIQTLILS